MCMYVYTAVVNWIMLYYSSKTLIFIVYWTGAFNSSFCSHSRSQVASTKCMCARTRVYGLRMRKTRI